MKVDATELARITRKRVYFTSAVWALLTTIPLLLKHAPRDFLWASAMFLTAIAMLFCLASAIAYFRFWPEYRAHTFRPLAVWLLSFAPITAGILIKILLA